MAYNAHTRIFHPDFEAKTDLPRWVPMGDDDQPDQMGQSTGSFVELLKKRMAGKGGEGGSSIGGVGAVAGGAGGEGGGMQSL